MTPTNSPSTQDTHPKDPSSTIDPMASFYDEDSTSATAKIASVAHSAVDAAAANLEHAEKALREARAAAGHKVHDGAMHAKSLSEDAVTSVKAYIDLYPLRSVCIALAAGFLISAMVKK